MTTPTLENEIPQQTATEDALWSYTVPAGTFADADEGDVLTLTATLADGSPLPEWLEFDESTGTFSGTPVNEDVGTLSVKVTATDLSEASVSATFDVVIANTNDAPTAEVEIAEQTATELVFWSYTLPAGAFEDVDLGDALTYTATLADGSALPSWISFDGGTVTFTGTPQGSDIGAVELKVVATDGSGASAFITFDLSVYGNIIYSNVSYVLPDFVWNLTLTGAAAIDGTGNALDNVIEGNSASNTLDGGTGIDTLIGGLGNDTYILDETDDAVIENAGQGTDTVRASASYTLSGNIENLTLTGSGDIDGTGNTLNNTILGNAGANVLNGGGGKDTMRGGEGDDSYYVDAGDTVTEYATEGHDSVFSSVSFTLGAYVENLTLTGTTSIHATGNAWANVITGNSGNNTLNGDAGADTMIGGLGLDNYHVDDAGDVVVELAGEGTDTVHASISYTLGDNLENLTLTGADATSGQGNAANNTLNGSLNSAANTLAGGLGNDTYVVDASDLVVELAGEGTDTVSSAYSHALAANVENLTLTGSADIEGAGNALDNTINGGTNSGANILRGRAGNDTYLVGAGDMVIEEAGEGIDTVKVSLSHALAANVENLTLTGTAAIDGTGNELANLLLGNTADNILDGGAGADTMQGGAGNDTYIVDNTADVVAETAPGGSADRVEASATFTLGNYIEQLWLTGMAAINGTGNAQANLIVGNGAANVLAGRGGDDTYVVGAGDTVVENANEGTDVVQSSISWTLSANVEYLVLTGTADIDGTGSAGNNHITGNAGNNYLDGGAGADTLVGGLGSDIYFVDNIGDVVVEEAGGGADVVYSTVTYTLGTAVESLYLAGTASVDGYGNSVDNELVGNAGANVLTGGAGDDVYIVSAGDTIVEYANEGKDQVYADVTWTLAANVEELTLTGSAAIDATGNGLNNRLDGSANTGANVLTGGAGDDFYILGDGDTVVEFANEGWDSVYAPFAMALGEHLDVLFLGGGGDFYGTGNALDNSIYGNAGNNLIDGGAGADFMTGGSGSDTYVVDDAGDRVTENGWDTGWDVVQSSVTFALGNNLEALTLTGSGSINGTGNVLDNEIRGNTGNNTLAGGAGSDTYLLGGNNGDDTVVENDATAGNHDVIQFGAGISEEDLWFEQSGNDLLVTVLGSNDSVLVKDWYLGDQYRVEEFRLTGSQESLQSGNVQQLVDAMEGTVITLLGLPLALLGVIDDVWN